MMHLGKQLGVWEMPPGIAVMKAMPCGSGSRFKLLQDNRECNAGAVQCLGAASNDAVLALGRRLGNCRAGSGLGAQGQ